MRLFPKHLLAGNIFRMYIRTHFLANFLNLPLLRMKKVSNSILNIAAIAVLMCTASVAHAQWGDWGGGGGTDTTKATSDTAAAAPVEGGWGDDGGWGGEKEEGPQMPERKQYVRFHPPYDSLREIIYYEGIIEDENCEFCTSDSLYYRARKYMLSKFGKDKLKSFIVEDKKADRITLKVTIPMISKYGQYKTENVGMLEYKVTLRFKDGRYKYQFGNFVHIQSPNGLAKESTRTYHEYYMKVKKGYQVSDKYLLAADREVKEFVEGLKKSLREPYQPDEDDW